MKRPQPPAPESESSTGAQARSAVEDVLRDQAEKARRRAEANPPPKDRSPALTVVAVLLAVGTVWALRAPPGFLQPAPPPVPPPALREAGLRLSVYVATLRVNDFLERNGRLPDALTEVFEGPEDLEGLTYERLDARRYRVTGTRDGNVVTYETGNDVDALVGGARQVLQGPRS